MATETYNRVNWKDSPSTETPINQTNLNKMDKGIKDNNTGIKAVEGNLTASDGLEFNFAKNPNGTGHGYTDENGNFVSFKTTHTETKSITANGTVDMGVDHKYRYAAVNVPMFPIENAKNILTESVSGIDIIQNDSNGIVIQNTTGVQKNIMLFSQNYLRGESGWGSTILTLPSRSGRTEYDSNNNQRYLAQAFSLKNNERCYWECGSTTWLGIYVW